MDINSKLIEAIFNLSRIMKGDLSSQSETLHLTIVQIHVLIFLKKNPESMMSDIASYLKIELSSATTLINKLVKEGLVSRKTDPTDRRQIRISLTKKGDTLMSEGMKQRSKRIEKHLSYLSHAEKTELLKILGKMVEKMEETYEK